MASQHRRPTPGTSPGQRSVSFANPPATPARPEQAVSEDNSLRSSHQTLVAEKLALEWRFSKLYKKYDRTHRDKVVLSTRVESLERELAATKEGKPSSEADKRADRLQARCKELEDKLERAEAQAAAAEAAVEQSKASARGDASKQELHMQVAQLEDALQAAQVESAKLQARLSALEQAGAAAARASQERDSALAEVAQLKAALKDKHGLSLDQSGAAAGADLDRLTPDQLKRVVGALQRRAAVLELDHTRQRAANAALQRQLFDAQCKSGEAEAERQVIAETSAARVDAIQRRLYEAERAAAQPQNSSTGPVLSQLKLENQDLHAQLRGQADALAEMNKKLNAAAAARQEALAQAAQVEAQLTSLREEHQRLQRSQQQLMAAGTGSGRHQEQRQQHNGKEGTVKDALIAALQREADEAAALASNALLEKAKVQAQLDAEAESRRELAGVFMAAAAQQARADRLQAALGFVDQVSTSAAPRDIIQEQPAGEGAKSSGARESESSSSSDDQRVLPPLVLAERLESALRDVDDIAGITPRRRIGHLEWREDGGGGGRSTTSSSSSEGTGSTKAASRHANDHGMAGISAQPHEHLAAAQWRAAAEQANARRLAKDLHRERMVRRTREALVRHELAAAEAKEDDARMRLCRALTTNELLCAAVPTSEALTATERQRNALAEEVEELQQRLTDLTSQHEELKATARETQARAAAAAQELQQARQEALGNRTTRPALIRPANVGAGKAVTQPAARTASGRATPSSPLISGVSATDVFAYPAADANQGAGTETGELSQLLKEEKLRNAALSGRLAVAEEAAARLSAAEAQAANERMRSDRMQRQLDIVQPLRPSAPLHGDLAADGRGPTTRSRSSSVKDTGAGGAAAAASDTVAALEGVVSGLQHDLRTKDAAAQEMQERHGAEVSQLQAQLDVALDRVQRLERRLGYQRDAGAARPSDSSSSSDDDRVALDEMKLDLAATLRELQDARTQLKHLQRQQDESRQREAVFEGGGAGASQQREQLTGASMASPSSGSQLDERDAAALQRLIDQACSTAESLATDLAEDKHPQTPQADKLAQTLEVAQRVFVDGRTSANASIIQEHTQGTAQLETIEGGPSRGAGESEAEAAAAAAAEVEKLRHDLETAQQEIDKLVDDNDLLAQEVETRQAQVDSLKRDMHELAQQSANAGAATVPRADYRQLQDVLKDTEKKLHEQEKTGTQLSSSVESLERRVKELEQQCSEAEEEKESLEAKLMAAKQEVSRLRSSGDKSHMEDLEERFQKLSADVSEGHKKRKELQEEIEDKDQQLQDAHQQLRQLRLDKEMAEDHAARLENNATDLDDQNRRLREENRQLRDDVDHLKRRVKELEEELRQLRAAIARLLGIPVEQVTVSRLNSLPPASQDGTSIDRELLLRANDPRASAVLSGSAEELRSALGRGSRTAWTPESGRFVHLRDRAGSASSHPGTTRPSSSLSDHSRRHSSRQPRSYPRPAVAIYDHTPDPRASDQELPLTRGESVLVLGPPRRDGLQHATVRGSRGLVPASHIKEMRGKQPRTRLLQHMAGDGVRSRAWSAGSRPQHASATAAAPSNGFPPGAAKVMRARHDFDPSEVGATTLPPEDLLPLKKGDIVTANVGATRDDGFVKAMAEDGDMGYVPLAFLSDASEEPAATAAASQPLPGQTYQERLGGTARPQEHFHIPTATVRMRDEEPQPIQQQQQQQRRPSGGAAATSDAPTVDLDTPRNADQLGDGDAHPTARPMSRDALDSAIRTRPSKKRSGLARFILGSPKHKFKPGAAVSPS